MPSQATAKNAPPQLDRYRRRDDFMRAYNPVTAEHRLLLTQAFRAFEHLEQMYELRDHLTKGQGLISPFSRSRLSRSGSPLRRGSLVNIIVWRTACRGP